MSKLNIVQIQSALLLPVTAAFIVDKLGIKPVEQVKRAVYWDAKDFTNICQGLIQHITAARNADFSKISADRPKKAETAPAADDAGFFSDEPAADDAGFFSDEPAVEEFF